MTQTKPKTPISGVKTGAAKTKAVAKQTAKPKGGKLGSAMTNQSAGYSAGELAKKPNADKIVNVANATGGAQIVETAATKVGADTGYVLPKTMTAELCKLVVVGGSLRAVREYVATHKPTAALAEGVSARTAPNAARAAEAAKLVGKKAPTKEPAPATKAPAKAPTTKVPAPVRAVGDRAYEATKKEDNSKPGSYRTYMISTIRAHKSTEAAKAAHVTSGQFPKERLNFKWAHDYGYIVLK